MLDAFRLYNSSVSKKVLDSPDYPQKILELIPHQQENDQNYYWQKYLSGLNKQKWLNISDSLGNVLGLTQLFCIVSDNFTTQKDKTDVDNDVFKMLVKIWEKIGAVDENKLKEILDNKLQDLSFGTYLLFNGLDETSYLQTEIRGLALKYTAQLFEKNLEPGEKFADYLVKSPLFSEESNKFFLFDSLITNNYKNQDLINHFNKYGYLLAFLDLDKLQNSNLYKSLEKINNRVAQYCYSIFNEDTKNLDYLVKIVQLTSMNDSEQDKFYNSFLQKYSPSLAESQEFIITLLEKELNFSSNSNLNYKYQETCDWLKEKYQINSDFFNLQNLNRNFFIWNESIEKIFEINSEQRLKILDRLIGDKFIVDTLNEWFSLDVNQPQINQYYLNDSNAWKNLTKNDLSKLISDNGDILENLTECLIKSGKNNFISGDLLYHLCEDWKKNSPDSSLLEKIARPTVTKEFESQDWLRLYFLKWHFNLDLQLNPPSDLSIQEKQQVYNKANEIIENSHNSEDKKRIFNDCKLFNLENNELCLFVLKVIKNYPEFEKRKELLDECIKLGFTYQQLLEIVEYVAKPSKEKTEIGKLIQCLKNANWSFNQQKSILKYLPQNSYDFNFLYSYICPERKLNISTIREDSDLMIKLLALEPSNSGEKDHYKKLIKELVKLDKQNKTEYFYLLESASEKIVSEVYEEISNEEINRFEWLKYLKMLSSNEKQLCIKLVENFVEMIAKYLDIEVSIIKKKIPRI